MFLTLNGTGSRTYQNFDSKSKTTSNITEIFKGDFVEAANHLDPKKRSYEESVDK